MAGREQQVEQALRASGVTVSGLKVRDGGQVISLWGAVPSDDAKQRAEQIVAAMGVKVANHLTAGASAGLADARATGASGESEARSGSTYIVKPGSQVTNFATLDQPGIKVAAVNNTTTMRGAIAHLKNAGVTGYQTYDEIFGLLKAGEIDAFALSRDQLNAMAKQIPGTRVLDETFKQTVTAVAVPPSHPRSLAFAVRFLTEAISNGMLRKAYDDNGLKDRPVRTQAK